MVEYRLAWVQQQSLGMLFWDVCAEPTVAIAVAPECQKETMHKGHTKETRMPYSIVSDLASPIAH